MHGSERIETKLCHNKSFLFGLDIFVVFFQGSKPRENVTAHALWSCGFLVRCLRDVTEMVWDGVVSRFRLRCTRRSHPDSVFVQVILALARLRLKPHNGWVGNFTTSRDEKKTRCD